MTVNRREMLGAVASLTAVAELATVCGARDTSEPAQVRPELERQAGRRSVPDGIYQVTVDRIVDGAHVVLLCERGDAVVGQLVVSRSRLPDVTAGAQFVAWVRDGGLYAVFGV